MRSSGEVMKPETYSYRTFLPERGGLYCQDIFGPVHWAAGEQRMAEDARADRWGHLVLPFKVTRGTRSGTRVWVVPPVHRPFSLLTAEQHRQFALERREALLALAAGDEWPYSDPVETLLAEEGLTDPEELERLEQASIESRLNGAYRSVINHSARCRRLRELDAPPDVVGAEEVSVREAVLRLDVELRAAGLPEAVLALALSPAGE
jgi:hypothetical protein